MQSSRFMCLVVATHVAFIVAHIHRHTRFIGESFRRQRNERTRQQLVHKRQELAAQLCAIQDHGYIKRYAEEKLHMKPISLSQVKKLEPQKRS